MNIEISPEAKKDLRKIQNSVRDEISQSIEDLADDPIPENSYVIHLLDGTEIQCLKLQEEDRNSDLNHRVTYDIKGGETVRIYGIFSRGPGYKTIKEETEKRI